MIMMTFQEGVVSNGTGQGGGEEEESDVILCHKHEGEHQVSPLFMSYEMILVNSYDSKSTLYMTHIYGAHYESKST